MLCNLDQYKGEFWSLRKVIISLKVNVLKGLFKDSLVSSVGVCQAKAEGGKIFTEIQFYLIAGEAELKEKLGFHYFVVYYLAL